MPDSHNAQEVAGTRLGKLWRMTVPLRLVVPLLLAALAPEVIRWARSHAAISSTGAGSGPDLGIKTLAQQVRSELAAVENEMRKKDEKPLFDLRAFEMELNFIVKASSSENLGVKTELVTAESDIQTGSERVQKLTLHWEAAKPEEYHTETPTKLDNGVIIMPLPAAKGGRR